MRRALATALTTSLLMPATGVAAAPVKQADLSARPAIHQALVALKRAHRARARAAEKRREERVAIPGYLAAIAQCESGGNPRAIGGGGQFRGLFQFTFQTWAAVGGHGDPAAAPVSEQVQRAAALYARSGPGQWPVCGR